MYFYHLMLRDAKVMRAADIRAALKRLEAMFGNKLLYL
jgi:hypothetical protein